MKKFIFISAISLLFFLSSRNIYADDRVDEYINRMTLREKIGQILLVGFLGETLTSEDIVHLKKITPGGVIFYSRNFEDARDIPPLISGIESIFKNNNLPMFFAIDQEGGVVSRIKGEYRPPSEPTIGAANSDGLAMEIGRSVGSALRSSGINVNLAPVLDVPSDIQFSPMTKRSYSNDSETVERLGIAYIRGLKEAGMLATAKHFPGIGRTPKDSHLGLPRITWKTQDEKNSDLLPFKSAVKSGVDIIMFGHFIAEPGDIKNPVSLSSYWMKDILRKDMGFDGLIMVDNIEMKPIEILMPIPEAAVQSFKAGVDIIMISHQPDKQEAILNALMDALNKGDISIERLNESLRRIIEAKIRIMSYNPPEKIINNLKDISYMAAENSVTVLKFRDAPPINVSTKDMVLFTGYNKAQFNAIRNVFMHTEILNTPLKKIKPEPSIKEFLKKFDVLFIDADYPDASEIISLCNNLNVKYVVLLTSYWNIQKTLDILQPKWIVILFEDNITHFSVVFDILTGARQAKGKIPYKFNLPSKYIFY